MLWLYYFTYTSLGHNGLLLCLQKGSLSGSRLLKFRSVWFTHDDFLPLVRDSWDLEWVVPKLKAALKSWNRVVFGKKGEYSRSSTEFATNSKSNGHFGLLGCFVS